MRIHITEPLFAWDELQDCPSLRTLKKLFESLPDATLLNQLRRFRGRGRNDYPVEVLWGVLVLTIALRHVTIEACLAELQRNEALRRLIGITSRTKVPKAWNMSRFMDVLGQPPHAEHLHAVFDVMVQRLAQVVPKLGAATAGDASALNARRSRDRANRDKHAAEQANPQTNEASEICYDVHGLPLPAGGRKEYKDDEGKVTKVTAWFGYKFHLLVDVKHEVVLAYQVSSTQAGDNQVLPQLLEEGLANLPEGRIETLAYDKACDDNETHQLLHQAKIKPLIQTRSLWGDEQERRLPGHEADSPVVYDEAGTLYCYDRSSDPPVRHRMAYVGHEPARGTLKYRCPAVHEGWSCPSECVCNKDKSYGLTVRVKQELDLRRFPPIPRATKKFERLYKGRTAVERVNARLKVFWGADDGNVTGATRFAALLGTIMVVHIAFATLLAQAPRWEGTLSHTRLSPIAKALQQQPSG
jgi:hypothetical protein